VEGGLLRGAAQQGPAPQHSLPQRQHRLHRGTRRGAALRLTTLAAALTDLGHCLTSSNALVALAAAQAARCATGPPPPSSTALAWNCAASSPDCCSTDTHCSTLPLRRNSSSACSAALRLAGEGSCSSRTAGSVNSRAAAALQALAAATQRHSGSAR
jgi:hypothetical protein